MSPKKLRLAPSNDTVAFSSSSGANSAAVTILRFDGMKNLGNGWRRRAMGEKGDHDSRRNAERDEE